MIARNARQSVRRVPPVRRTLQDCLLAACARTVGGHMSVRFDQSAAWAGTMTSAHLRSLGRCCRCNYRSLLVSPWELTHTYQSVRATRGGLAAHVVRTRRLRLRNSPLRTDTRSSWRCHSGSEMVVATTRSELSHALSSTGLGPHSVRDLSLCRKVDSEVCYFLTRHSQRWRRAMVLCRVIPAP